MAQNLYTKIGKAFELAALNYCLTNYIGEKHIMKLTKEMCKVIADMEYLIGSECYNPNSYDGWNDIEGCDYRYPINVPSSSGNYIKIRNNINSSPLINSDDITKSAVSFMKYKFGTNELFIGKGLQNVLNYLEKRYNLNFNELEKSLDKK